MRSHSSCTVRYFLSHGADTNADTFNDMTILLFAARQGHLVVVQYLVSVGVDINATDMFGKSVHDYATSKAMKDMLRIEMTYQRRRFFLIFMTDLELLLASTSTPAVVASAVTVQREIMKFV
jgi:hypothetical protein